MQKGYESTKTLRSEKVDAILKDLTEAPFQNNIDYAYCDSSHMFVKVFEDVAMDYFHKLHGDEYQIDVIVLRRYLPLVLRSYMRLNIWKPDLPLERYSGGEYSLNHRHVAITKPYAPNTEQDTLDLALGYLIDFEAQAKRFKEKYPDIRVIEVRLEDLQEYQGAYKLFQDLGLEMTPATEQLLNKPYNQKFEKDSPEMKTPQPLGMYYQRIQEFMKKYEDRNLTLPPLPHLSLHTWCSGYVGKDPHGEMCPLEADPPVVPEKIPWNILPKKSNPSKKSGLISSYLLSCSIWF